jgi:hypothetical protein
MIPTPKETRPGSSARITANLEFTSNGYLRAVYLNAVTDGDQEILERALHRLLKPGHIGWVRRLIRWGQQ